MMILRQGMSLVAGGLIAGLVAALALGGVLRDFLFEVRPGDPLTLVAVSLVLLAVAAGACLVPARRATRVSPTIALRSE